ncbi:MAG: sensor histidine kinase [Bryobacterales bacterium]|nr:sensor histidine kinase [Bryobacterales bacterium]
MESRTNVKTFAVVAVALALITAGHYLTPPEYALWHGIFQRLYYLPVVLAAIASGWRGGLATAVVAGLLYIPHIFQTWSHEPHYALEQYAEIFMFVAVGCLTGILADREKRQRVELQDTAQKLSKVYTELQNTFEQVKRADRMSAIGQLAAGLAHEIRNPLSSIDGAAEVMEAAEQPEVVRAETMSIIRKECARLNRLLTNLLDFARPRAPEQSRVDLLSIFNSVIELVRHSAAKGIQFRTEVPENLPPLVGDREQIAQVMLNLAINAAQASGGEGEIVLRAFEADNALVVEVQDNGMGIPKENREKIFDPFFTTKESGTGLGLSVVQQIVTQHGGTVSVAPQQGKGTTFSLRFPRPQQVSA